MSYWRVGSRLETALILYQLTRSAYPESYVPRLHLRMPWFVGLTSNNAFARLEISNRLSRRSLQFGPFRTRDEAALYEESLLGLYQIRRCSEKLEPSVEHPGCIYGEMNQCLRPCQCAVSEEEYASESARVADFLATTGKSALKPLAAARDRAAAEMDFEQAAQAHKRIEKIKTAMATRNEVVCGAEAFHGIAVTRAAEADTVNLWPMLGGYWQTPIPLYLPPNQEQGSRSLDAMLRERLEHLELASTESGDRLEQLAVFARWYYSSWRDGHWFAFEEPRSLNYRRMVKSISALIKGE